MAHPKMFDDDDPYLARVRELALGFPGVEQKVSHGRPVFYTKKIFVYYGGSVKAEPEWVQHGQAVLFLPDEDEHPALVQDERCFVPAYLGPYGWVGMDLDASTDWQEVAELLETSYRRTAPVRLLKELDARAG